jgi:hypothetical protein
MEALQFDSRHPRPKYEDWVSELAEDLAVAPVICRERAKTRQPRGIAGLGLVPEPLAA